MLNPKQKAFIEAYLRNGGNATQAAIAAGYSERTAMQQGSRLLSHVEVSAHLKQRAGKVAQKLEITTERILQERARLAFFDPGKLLDDDGRPRPLTQLDEDTRRAIAGVKIVTQGNQDIGLAEITEFKLADKNASLTALEKIHGLYRDEDKHEGALNIFIHLG